MSNVLKTREVMERLRVKDPDTLYALVKSKRLHAVKLGREYRITEEAVAAFLAGDDVKQQQEREAAEQRRRDAKPEAIRTAPQAMRR